MIKSKLLLLFITISLTSCSSQNGYSDLDKLYSDFVVYLQDSSIENLKDYCYAITPDQGTVDYMKKNGFSYRGIPDELEKRKIEPSYIGDKYYESVLAFKEKLIREKQLTGLKYIGRERDGEELYDERLKIYATETFILMESKGDTIRCKLGEMFKINDKWKSFTSPKLGW